jgi:hypothetical protein
MSRLRRHPNRANQRITVARETLKQNLDQLHAELRTARTLDPETRAMLEAVANDIEQALEGSAADDAQTVRERIDTAAVRFEAEHPQFARILSEVTDALAKIGV